jgi:hypothetical protein
MNILKDVIWSRQDASSIKVAPARSRSSKCISILFKKLQIVANFGIEKCCRLRSQHQAVIGREAVERGIIVKKRDDGALLRDGSMYMSYSSKP